MYEITNQQLRTLREVLHWRAEEQTHKVLLNKAKDELNKSLEVCQSEEIPPHIINLILLDRNGSGVAEILKENEITISE